jgi:hypothetical protein
MAMLAVIVGLVMIGRSLSGSVPSSMPWNVHLAGPIYVIVGLLLGWIWDHAR